MLGFELVEELVQEVEAVMVVEAVMECPSGRAKV